jgi:UrcA family protein
MYMKTLETLLILTLASLAAEAAMASSAGKETTSVVVTFSDLNLHSPAGIAKLHSRISAAAHQVCGSADRHNLSAVSQVRACKSQAVARAMASVNVPAPDKLASRSQAIRQVLVPACAGGCTFAFSRNRLVRAKPPAAR